MTSLLNQRQGRFINLSQSGHMGAVRHAQSAEHATTRLLSAADDIEELKGSLQACKRHPTTVNDPGATS
jgi:hypothetical protein